MDRAFDSVEESTRSLVTDMQSNLVLIKLVAEDLERAARGCDEVKILDSAVLELLSSMEELERHRKAMQALKASYRYNPNQLTDFSKACEEHTENIAVTDPKEHTIYKKFEEAIWNVHNSGVPMPGQEQAEIMCTTQVGILNTTCPISGKHVTELEEPVRCSDCRHIYELQAARIYIGRYQRKCCAAAGCPKHISLQNLVKDATLAMEIAELRMRGESARTHTHTVVEELDDILDVEAD